MPLSEHSKRWLDPQPGWVTAARRNVYLVLADGEAPPEVAEFDAYVDRGDVDGDTWRLTVGAYTAPGIPVWSGHSESVAADVPPGASLRVATVGMASLPDFFDESQRLTFRVELDGEPLLVREQTLRDFASVETHVLPLPPDGVRNARFTFRVEGAAAVAGFPLPDHRPGGRRAARKRAAQRRRPAPEHCPVSGRHLSADNMALYGGELGLTPELDRFAESCLRFERAWSVSAWTLPAQTTMLSGLHPHQHGVTAHTRKIADEVITIAERLQDAGYRTGAITGGGYLSPAFGFDQGFSWFDQSWVRWDVEDTTDDVEDFLDIDDGRPIFLFVQTFRAHGPYVVRDETREHFADTLQLTRDWHELSTNIASASETWREGQPFPAPLATAVTDLRDLYQGAVHDLDRGFGVFLDMLERRGLGQSFLLFTSDHGEAFAEHDNMQHGDGVWDEMTRIPLLLRGPGIRAAHGHTPRRRWWTSRRRWPTWPVSRLRPVGKATRCYVSIAIAPRSSSTARSVNANYRGAIIDGKRKLTFADEDTAIEAGQIDGIFDLVADPLEKANLLAPGAWSDEDREWLVRTLGAVREARVESDIAVLDGDSQAAMDALGYTGDD